MRSRMRSSIGLVDVTHHDLGLGGVGQERQTACRFDLVGDPIPVPDGLQGDGSAFREVLQEGLDRARFVVDPGLALELAILIQEGELRIATMGVATHSIMRHRCTSFICVLSRHKWCGRCSAFI